MKTILVHMGADQGEETRFRVAVDIARRIGGHLTCLQPVASLESYLPVDPYGAAVFAEQALERVRKMEKEQRHAWEERLRREGMDWDWQAHHGSPVSLMVAHSWLAELMVVSVPASDWRSRFEMPPIAADVVVRSRIPMLAVPNGMGGFDCGGTALIAWNGSFEACQALRSALPLLKLAGRVVLATIPDDGNYELPPAEATKFLTRHGVEAEIMEMEGKGKPIAALLRHTAAECSASYVVMGAYGHSRFREVLLGGVTREMLIDSPLPLLLAH
jgi:nucleotide-binding universal stress UspA family protein